jgi:HEAT repeats
MLGFVRTGNEALVWCLGDPQRAVAAYHELLRRGQDAVGAIRAGLHHQNPAVREGCCRLLDHLADTGSMGQLIAMADDPDARVRTAAFHALAADALFIGDTMTTRNVLTGATGPKPAPFTLEPGQALASLGHIREVDATWVLPGHGPAWDGGVAEAVRLTREAAPR